MKNVPKEITPKEGFKILSKTVPQILFQTINALYAINPIWGVLFATATGIITAWGGFGQSRINELVNFISEHKDEFVKEVIERDDFKTLFLNVMERHMKEASEEKRRLLRNYLLNIGKGIEPDFNEYSRMNNVLDTISLAEVDMLKLWDKDGPIGSYLSSQSNFRTATMNISDIQHHVFNMKPRDEKLMAMVANENKNKNNQTLLLLGYKGLLYVLAEDNVGSGQESKVVEITNFGQNFLKFIKD